MESEVKFRFGFVAIIGLANVGKSTLLNRFVGEKIAITSRKPQTTRNRILGIAHRPKAQFAFIDTPGIHKSEKILNRRIVDMAFKAIEEADLLLWMVDINYDLKEKELISEKLKDYKKPVILVLNKIDMLSYEKILSAIDTWRKVFDFSEIVPVSAKNGDQVEELMQLMEAYLPEGPALFPEDSLTDMPLRFLVAELIREKVFRRTGEEIPYSVAVSIDSYIEGNEKEKTKIYASINVDRESQKGIAIGKGGRCLKEIGTDARAEIEELIGGPVFLKLFVRVEKNWTKNAKLMNRFGY